MRLILHVGMGKTGTSAIQAALKQNPDVLAKAGAHYLGMRVDFLDPPAEANKNQAFLKIPVADKIAYAARVSAHLAGLAGQGIHTAILSNEGLWGASAALRPFISALDPAIAVTVVGYVRNPDRWLPSAYAQWGIADKVARGGIKSYDEIAEAYATRYGAALDWRDEMEERFLLRHYDVAGDVVTDFLGAIGVSAPLTGARANARRNRGELALRALFNNRFPGHAVPGLFDAAVIAADAPVLPLADLARQSFDTSRTAEILDRHADLWQSLKAAFGIDLRSGVAARAETVTPEALRVDVLDTLVEVVLQLAQRVAELEGPKALRKGRAAEPLTAPQRAAEAALQAAAAPEPKRRPK